jgi:serine/threonine protein kinase, bacterial
LGKPIPLLAEIVDIDKDAKTNFSISGKNDREGHPELGWNPRRRMQPMIPNYCSRGHVNASENRFCSTCGEKLLIVQPGTVLGERYRIGQELGHGGFGRTYLAQDINRFNELCVLKEFAPQVQGTYALEKSEELFEREAGILYKLNHAQIPRFRELFRAALEGRDRLFLVQDYVEGRTYRQLLEARRHQGTYFSETEVRQL